MFKPQFGISLHTVAPLISDELLDALKNSAVKTLEIMPTLFNTPDPQASITKLQTCLRQTSIPVKTIHCVFGGDCDPSSLDPAIAPGAKQTLQNALDLAVKLDAPMVVVHASFEPIPADVRQARLNQAVGSLQAVTDFCRNAGIQIAVELLPRTCLGNTADELQTILARLDPDTFGVCLDVNHLMDRPHTLSAAVRQLGKQLITLHLSDYDGIDEKHWLPGQGVLDWKAFMQALRDIDYQGPFNYECSLPKDAAPCERIALLQTNFDWLGNLK